MTHGCLYSILAHPSSITGKIGALLIPQKKSARQDPDSFLQSAGEGLDDYCTPIEPYHIDNKSLRRIVKITLTRFLTSLEMLEKVNLLITKDLENA